MLYAGEKLTSVDTGTMKNSDACVSPCGRFVAVCGRFCSECRHSAKFITILSYMTTNRCHHLETDSVI